MHSLTSLNGCRLFICYLADCLGTVTTSCLSCMFTWLIAAGDFTHVIAGSNEIFTLVLSGEMNIFTALNYHIFPVLLGNILGGTGLFAMLAYGQVHEEM